MLLRGIASSRRPPWGTPRFDALSYELDRRTTQRQEYAPLIRSAIETGARLGELTGADWSDVDLDAGVWNVNRQWTKAGELGPVKTRNGVRRIPLTPEFVRYLKAYRLRSRFSQDADPVFAAMGRGVSRLGGGSRLTHRNVQRRAWEPIRVALELPEQGDVSPTAPCVREPRSRPRRHAPGPLDG